MALICKIFGHKWKKGWIGAIGGPFGSVSIDLKRCERCMKEEREYTSHIEPLEVS